MTIEEVKFNRDIAALSVSGSITDLAKIPLKGIKSQRAKKRKPRGHELTIKYTNGKEVKVWFVVLSEEREIRKARDLAEEKLAKALEAKVPNKT